MKDYQTPTLEIIPFSLLDVITSSRIPETPIIPIRPRNGGMDPFSE